MPDDCICLDDDIIQVLNVVDDSISWRDLEDGPAEDAIPLILRLRIARLGFTYERRSEE